MGVEQEWEDRIDRMLLAILQFSVVFFIDFDFEIEII